MKEDEIRCPRCGHKLGDELIKVKWEAMENMALFLAHELKNPLFVLSSKVEREYQSDTELRKIVSHLSSIVSNILILLGKGEPICKKHNIEAILLQVVDEIKTIFPDASVQTDFRADKIFAEVDEFLIKRALSNVIQNAIESYADDEKKKVLITTEDFENGICISIRDEGQGMDGEVLSKIFTPFFTTKARGTGVGMSVVKKVVEMHGGKVEVRSEKGKGTEVKIFLPASEL